MSDELLTIILATLVGLVPNLIIKWAEKQKPREELEKTSIESADITLDMQRDLNSSLSAHIKFQDERLALKKEEIKALLERIKQLEDENCILKARLEKDNAV